MGSGGFGFGRKQERQLPATRNTAARGRAGLVVRRRTGPAGAERNRAGRVRSPRGVGAVHDAAAWVPQLIARLGKIAPALAERYALTMPDLLGFGASTKPREHRYSL